VGRILQVEQPVVDDDVDADVEDEGAGAEEDDMLFADHGVAAEMDAAEQSIDTSSHNILVSAVDPVVWKTELG
jgi:hypothetical protein